MKSKLIKFLTWLVPRTREDLILESLKQAQYGLTMIIEGIDKKEKTLKNLFKTVIPLILEEIKELPNLVYIDDKKKNLVNEEISYLLSRLENFEKNVNFFSIEDINSKREELVDLYNKINSVKRKLISK